MESDVIVSQLDVSTKQIFNSTLDLDSVTAVTAADDRPWRTEPRKWRRGLLVARTLLPGRIDNLPVRVLNTSDQPIKLDKHTG